MICPRCSSAQHTKSGIINNRQRFKCKDCKYHFTVEKRSNEYPKSLKKKALLLYLEGLGFRSIERILGVSNVTVLKWIRAFGEEVASLQSSVEDIEVVELDEMHSYIGNKKTTVGFGLLLIDLERNSSISLLATGVTKPQWNYGKRFSKIK